MKNSKRQLNSQQDKRNQLTQLKDAKTNKDDLRFRKLMNKMLPALRNYIARRLNLAHSTGLIDKYGIVPEEVIDVVYLTLFDRFGQEHKNTSGIETWVYRVVDEVFNKQLMEKSFENDHLIYLKHMEDLELSGLEEKYTADAEGELIMDEELDDVSYQQRMYNAADFLKDTNTLESVESTLSEYDKIKLHDEIQRQLISVAEEDRTIFDLFWIVGLSMKQIANIRNITISEVEKTLKRVGAHIRKKLSSHPGSRYSR
jgi:RNA polymerase sigma factor (sigma-70 family)